MTLEKIFAGHPPQNAGFIDNSLHALTGWYGRVSLLTGTVKSDEKSTIPTATLAKGFIDAFQGKTTAAEREKTYWELREQLRAITQLPFGDARRGNNFYVAVTNELTKAYNELQKPSSDIKTIANNYASGFQTAVRPYLDNPAIYMPVPAASGKYSLDPAVFPEFGYKDKEGRDHIAVRNQDLISAYAANQPKDARIQTPLVYKQDDKTYVAAVEGQTGMLTRVELDPDLIGKMNAIMRIEASKSPAENIKAQKELFNLPADQLIAKFKGLNADPQHLQQTVLAYRFAAENFVQKDEHVPGMGFVELAKKADTYENIYKKLLDAQAAAQEAQRIKEEQEAQRRDREARDAAHAREVVAGRRLPYEQGGNAYRDMPGASPAHRYNPYGYRGYNQGYPEERRYAGPPLRETFRYAQAGLGAGMALSRVDPRIAVPAIIGTGLIGHFVHTRHRGPPADFDDRPRGSERDYSPPHQRKHHKFKAGPETAEIPAARTSAAPEAREGYNPTTVVLRNAIICSFKDNGQTMTRPASSCAAEASAQATPAPVLKPS